MKKFHARHYTDSGSMWKGNERNQLVERLKTVAGLKDQPGLACREDRGRIAGIDKADFANAEPSQRLNEESNDNICWIFAVAGPQVRKLSYILASFGGCPK
jgi:hypothetical protein